MCDAAQDSAEAPDKNAYGDEPFARHSIPEKTEEGRSDKIAEHERRAERAALVIIEAEILLQIRQHGGEHRAIEIVEEI